MRGLLQAAVAAFRARFMVGVICPEYRGVHWVWTLQGATEWVLQYPARAAVLVVVRGNPKWLR